MFKFIENLKIREIIYRYRDFKKQNPTFNENQISRLTIQKRLRDYPYLYNLRNNSDACIEAYMADIFQKEVDLKYVCVWFMEQEYKRYNLLQNAHNLNGWRIAVKDLEKRIDALISKIPGI